MLKKSARDFLEKECPKTLIRELEKDNKGYSLDLWRKMVDLGWIGLVIPEEYGGAGQSFLDLAILLEEMGRAILPGPFFSTVVLGALPVIAAGTEEQKREFLPKIAKGELIMTLALTEPDIMYDAAGITVKATVDKDDYVINGTKLFVFNAHIADWMLCVTRTKDGANPEEGITVFLVDAKTPGIEVTVLDTMGDDKQCEIVFNNVKVPKKNILGELDRGWEMMSRALEQATVAQCALMMGQGIQVAEMTTEYVKTRVQFGKPIGTFQVTAHRTVDQWILIEGVKSIVYQAAWMISEGLPCAKEVSLAKAWANKACSFVCIEAHQTHGGIGITTDFDLGLYTRRSKAGEYAFGDTDFHKEMVVQQLGL